MFTLSLPPSWFHIAYNGPTPVCGVTAADQRWWELRVGLTPDTPL